MTRSRIVDWVKGMKHTPSFSWTSLCSPLTEQTAETKWAENRKFGLSILSLPTEWRGCRMTEGHSFVLHPFPSFCILFLCRASFVCTGMLLSSLPHSDWQLFHHCCLHSFLVPDHNPVSCRWFHLKFGHLNNLKFVVTLPDALIPIAKRWGGQKLFNGLPQKLTFLHLEHFEISRSMGKLSGSGY